MTDLYFFALGMVYVIISKTENLFGGFSTSLFPRPFPLGANAIGHAYMIVRDIWASFHKRLSLVIYRTIDINHSSMVNGVLRKLVINRNPF